MLIATFALTEDPERRQANPVMIGRLAASVVRFGAGAGAGAAVEVGAGAGAEVEGAGAGAAVALGGVYVTVTGFGERVLVADRCTVGVFRRGFFFVGVGLWVALRTGVVDVGRGWVDVASGGSGGVPDRPNAPAAMAADAAITVTAVTATVRTVAPFRGGVTGPTATCSTVCPSNTLAAIRVFDAGTSPTGFGPAFDHAGGGSGFGPSS